ncbi:MAG: carboxypeptidase regulatory-like domain-containing protein [Fibrobacteria bacterium]|nr:carboxypeptidase regulatory-like domain-containing protein [Fibrobacteria bacterium]
MFHVYKQNTILSPLGFSLVVCSLLLILSGCLNDQVTGTTTTGNTGNGTITGMIHTTDGQPVANAKIRVVPVDYNPGPNGSAGNDFADVTYTKEDGKFQTDSLADGTYNLLGDKEGQVAFRDSISVHSNAPTEAGKDLLLPPGSVAGIVRLQPGHDSRTVFLVLLGTTALGWPEDSIGHFELNNLAQGEYHLRVLSTLDAYKPLDIVITVQSDVQTTLEDTIRLEYQQSQLSLPAINDVRISYDSNKIAAQIYWGAQDPAKVGSYFVYRKHSDSIFVRLNTVPVTDTFFVDNWQTGLQPGNVYQYTVTPIDLQGNEGLKGLPAMLVVDVGYNIEMNMQLTGCAPGLCQFDVDDNGDIYLMEYTGKIIHYDSQGTAMEWTDPNPKGYGSRPIKVDPPGNAVYILYNSPLRVGQLDADGNSAWITTLPFNRDVAFSLHQKGDSLLVWAEELKIMTFINKNGEILGQDSALQTWVSSDLMNSPLYKESIGFYQNLRGTITLLDWDGQLLDSWIPEPRGYLADIDRDDTGIWYLGWDSGTIDVYSSEKILLGSILIGEESDGIYRLLFKNGLLYAETSPSFKLLRIDKRF